MGPRKWVLPLSLALVLVLCSVCPANSITLGTYSRGTIGAPWGTWTETFPAAGAEGQPGCIITAISSEMDTAGTATAWALQTNALATPESFTSTAAAVLMSDGLGNSWYETPYEGGRLVLRKWTTEWGDLERYYDLEGVVKFYTEGANAGKSFLTASGLDAQFTDTFCYFSAEVVETSRNKANTKHSGDILSWDITITKVSPAAAVPEPVTMMGLLVCCGAVGGYLRRRSRLV